MKRHTSKQDIKIAVDAVIFTIKDDALQVLLIQMKKSPFEDMWAVPGGLLDDNETARLGAQRILGMQTGVSSVYLEQLKTFDAVDRDPAGRVISIAYYALFPNNDVELHTTDKYKSVKWWPVSNLPKLAYDHKQIIEAAVNRLSAKIQYTNIVWSLLPEEFTLTEIQHVYEVIMGRTLDKRNFRKRINELRMIKPTGKKRYGMAHRPAALYTFKHRELEFVEVV